MQTANTVLLQVWCMCIPVEAGSGGDRLVGAVLDLSGLQGVSLKEIQMGVKYAHFSPVVAMSSVHHGMLRLNMKSWHNSHQLIHTHTPINCIGMRMHHT